MKSHFRRPHDLGGLNEGAIIQDEHFPELWEKRVDSVLRLLCDKKRKILTVDELRRGIEDLGPGAYETLNYYERWISSITNLLLEKNIIEVDELGQKMAKIESRWSADRTIPRENKV